MGIKSKINKCKEAVHEHGLWYLIKKIGRFIRYKLNQLINKSAFVYGKNYKRYAKQIKEILKDEKYDAIVVFDSRVGWNIPLFQRSQHMANELTDKGFLYFYRTSEQFDSHIKGIEKLKDRLFLTNMSDYALQNALFDVLKEYKGAKFLSLYSTDVYLDEEYIAKNYINSGFHIIYEYIDELSDEISGHLPDFVYDRHENIIKDLDNYIVASADKLIEEVEELRGKENVAMITNGVQYRDWQFENREIPEKLKDIIAKGNPIIGYFGALAKWFDYDLVRFIAENRPDYEIVLIGFLYDDSFKNSGIEKLKNVHYLGVIDYKELPKHAKYFTISTIPFLLNDITESTSPVKLFEYMAMGTPIVTTDLRECRKYNSVLIGKGYNDFVEKLDEALSIDRKGEYYQWLEREALDNTWSKKAEVLYDLVKKNM